MTSGPNPQDPNSPLYDFIDTQPADEYPVDPPAGDSSLSHFTTRQFTPTNILPGMPPVVTYASHGLQNGQAIRATKFVSMPFAVATGMEQLNNQLYYVQLATTDTFGLFDQNAQPIDGRGFTFYIGGGEFTLVGQDLLVVNPSEFPPLGDPPFPPV